MKKLFSLIALAGVIAACTPEQIETAFKLAGAKGTIEVEVVKLDGTPYQGQFQITGYDALPGNSISYAGNKATISFQASESAAIALADLTLTATGENILYPETGKVTVPSLLAGQEVKLTCRIRVGQSVGDWYVSEEFEEAGEPQLLQRALLANSHYATYAYSHAANEGIDSWYVNNSEFMLTGKTKIPYKTGYSAGYDVEIHDYAGVEVVYVDYLWGLAVPVVVKDWVEEMSEPAVKEGEEDYEFSVSAWAMWNVFSEIYSTPVTASLVATKLDADLEQTDESIVLASLKYDYFQTIGGVVELPYPEAAGHYVEGHGHANGANNAGGGMSVNE